MRGENTMDFDDRIFGDLERKEFLIEREAQELSHIILEEIIPEDPTPMDEITLSFLLPPLSEDYIYLYYNTDNTEPDLSSQKITLVKDKIYWKDSIFNFAVKVKAKIPLQKEEKIIKIKLGGEDKISNELYSFSIDYFSPPKWVDTSVIYHIFVDRFAKDAYEVPWSDNLKMKLGGNLKGITKHLDYIESLETDVIWLSPIFKAASYHGYDIEDYYDIDSAWGSKEDLKELVNKAFNRGIRIILDFVPNHLSSNHPIFQNAIQNQNSLYRNWFIFDENGKYETFCGVKTMPKINLKNKEAMDHIINAALYWIREFGISGYRLDHATGPDFNFWTEYYFRLKNKFPDTFHLGEIVDTPLQVKKYAGKLDGTLDFFLFKIMREFFIGKKWLPAEFQKIIGLKQRFYNKNFKTVSFLENHDSNRFLWVAKDKKLLKIAAIFQFTHNDIPVIYNGEEMGANQYRDILEGTHTLHEFTRLPIPWKEENQDLELINFFKKLVSIRKAQPSLYGGDYIPIFSEILSYYKVFGNEKILVLINTTDKNKNYKLDGIFKDLITEKIYEYEILLPPMEGYILLQVDR